MVRAVAGGGLLGLIGALFGRGAKAAAKDTPVTCNWEIEAHGSSGPNSNGSYNGILTVTIKPNGAIDKGSYVLVDGSWQPLIDTNGHKIAFDVVGSTHLRSIDFRAERDGCDELAFTGVNRFLVDECRGPMSGSFHGPELTDLGGWRTRRTDFCPPCRGATCPPETYLDSDSCTCVPKCPGGHKVCKDLVCVPEECPENTTYDEERCVCGCKEKRCKPGELWCPFACDCIPCSPCREYECPPGYVHYLAGEDICICVKKTCPKDVVCKPEELLIYNGVECRCGDCCKKTECPSGQTWDEASCSCKPACQWYDCVKIGYVWDDATCSCVRSCEKRDCPAGSVWSDEQCDCLPQGCPPINCPNDNYTVDPKTCACVCQEQQCSGNLTWDPNKCVCQCQPLPCPQGYDFDTTTCSCVPGACAPQPCDQGYEWNPGQCACVCTEQTCTGNYVWSVDSCACICGVDACYGGYTFDKDSCSCIPTDPCSTAPPCPEGMIQDPQTCGCSCPDGQQICGDGCKDQQSGNCGACGVTCKFGCCQGKCCLG